MIDYENMRLTVVKGLKKYLNCPVIRSNQNAEMPKYPYVSYHVTTLMSQNNGTYGEYDDGVHRKPVTSTWSITAVSDDNSESVMLAMKAREWLEHAGTVYLNDNDVIVQSVTGVANRDNIITAEYEYRNGFDCFFTCVDEIKMQDEETIEDVSWGEDLNKRLESRLDGVKQFGFGNSQKHDDEDTLNDLLEKKLNGVR